MGETWRQLGRFKDQSWSTIFKTALVRLPRAVPIEALHLTNPEGPQPFVLQLPSRESGRSIPLYIFVPHVRFRDPKATNAIPAPHSFPVVMDYHGGGFYLGSCLEQAPFCAKLCRELDAIVICVDYRMAPFNKFPAAIEDAEDVVSAVLDSKAPGYDELRQSIVDFLQGHWFDATGTEKDRKAGKVPMPPKPQVELDTSRIAFSGASSGGNIALNMALDVPASLGLPDWPSRIASDHSTSIPLLLLYPALDLRQLPSERYRHERMPPVSEHKRLDIDDHLAATYVSREMARHGRASPGLVDTSRLHDKAKILLILSGIDTLWEQSKLWVDKVESEGRGHDMKTMRYENAKHGWTTIPEIALSAQERKSRIEVLNACINFTRAAWQGEDPVGVVSDEVGDVVGPKANGDGQSDAPQDQALADLLDMGFPPQAAQLALKECNGSVDDAAKWLLQHGEEEKGQND